ncbi:histidinol-phosphatase [Sedimentisphaera salicampi]|uniref:histidinol-phosphatase n=1 Tax=Sedimentisphaera salicampi TaxID=1941349 RepID=UPI000B9D4D07|nr:histidinol-phosphatase [Sedimentisphaera salicampi]OXU14368.1 histidinol-phosphatase [Sedimentisphaera salicampi]
MKQNTTNYHTHTYRCKHALGDAADYCSAAEKAGLKAIGISDHTPLPDGKWASVRMEMDELPDYCEKIEDAKKEFAGRLEMYSGMECEYFPRYEKFYNDTLREEFGIEYLAIALHFYPLGGEEISTHAFPMGKDALKSYTDLFVEGIKTKIFDFAAHPDLFLARYPSWDSYAESCSERICTAAANSGVALEINGYGFCRDDFSGYPNDNFWKIAANCGAKGVINSDAHCPEHIDIGFERCLDLAERLGVSLVDPVRTQAAKPS